MVSGFGRTFVILQTWSYWRDYRSWVYGVLLPFIHHSRQTAAARDFVTRGSSWLSAGPRYLHVTGPRLRAGSMAPGRSRRPREMRLKPAVVMPTGPPAFGDIRDTDHCRPTRISRTFAARATAAIGSDYRPHCATENKSRLTIRPRPCQHYDLTRSRVGR
jgi:hypothetical protein